MQVGGQKANAHMQSDHPPSSLDERTRFMEIHEIPYICVAEAGSFTTAVHLFQPLLSQQIIKLQDELGAELFHRFYPKIRLTGVGQTFFSGTQNALRDISSAKAEVHEMTASGTLKMGAIPTVQSTGDSIWFGDLQFGDNS